MNTYFVSYSYKSNNWLHMGNAVLEFKSDILTIEDINELQNKIIELMFPTYQVGDYSIDLKVINLKILK